MQLDLVAVVELVELLLAEDLLQHEQSLLEALQGVGVLADVQVGHSHRVECLGDDRVLVLVPEWLYLHLLPQEVDRFLRVLEVAVALRDVNDCLHWPWVVVSVIVGLGD